MSKQIKQMEMDALKRIFHDVRDMVLLTVVGVNAQVDNQMRLNLRKKNIQLKVVKNSLAHRVFDELEIKVGNVWEKPTLVAWGGASIAELSRELETIIKKSDKIKVKTAVLEGQELPFSKAIKMPTRAEAAGRVVALAMSPACRLVSQALTAGARLAGQIKTLAERVSESVAEGAPEVTSPAPAPTA